MAATSAKEAFVPEIQLNDAQKKLFYAGIWKATEINRAVPLILTTLFPFSKFPNDPSKYFTS